MAGASTRPGGGATLTAVKRFRRESHAGRWRSKFEDLQWIDGGTQRY